MILRGAAGRKMPYGRVNVGDVPYLLENDGSGKIWAKTKVGSVFNSEKMVQANRLPWWRNIRTICSSRTSN
jgi:hypothetical protein